MDYKETYNIKCDEYCLGEYKSKERAIEVLDEIHYLLANTNYNGKADDYEIKTSEIVCQMPIE